LLFFTSDGKFIIKTLKKSEFNFLKKNIKKYGDYLQKNKDSLLIRYTGLYIIKYKNTLIRLVSMNNLFGLNKMETVYDLKGSTEGRFVKKDEKILKDLDLMKNKFHLKFEKKNQLQFLLQINEDTKFLTELDLMDYSLLVGVLKCGTPKKVIGNGRFGFIKSLVHDEYYYIGIIDFLQVWNLKKKLELKVKSITTEKFTLSVLPPKEYSLRFNDFMSNNLVFEYI
jgi:1-phosphatidylinositol-4-phosphate 5-kinase